MKIWDLQEDVNVYEHITLVNGSNEDWIKFGDMFQGKQLREEWQPLKLKLIQHGGTLKKGDMPYLSPGVPVFSDKAIHVLKSQFSSCVEVLDTDCDIGDYKIINVIKVINCLDYEKSEILRYRDSDRIKAISKYVFKLDLIEKLNIFKIVEQPRGKVFVSDEFRNKVIQSGLEGFKFIEVWDSEE
ncbi:imm11 family protein [Clostridium septicum]|uniref:Immunity MXAN-0049 protein domain-containing protein n=1 Tax=Clostridium septicum TaxID=1504 RepID=A0A9N7JKM9_CLOSE|nr:DUF1629 domain-containing protein [Clostridium septicum]AYE33979.1 hypothetical protein CP523_05585 [Clostridium septicum]QAS59344.1 hypothetical protein EI377_00020 [Clostridium septicum]QAS62121.1 hypothetical protein EI377_16100 [Clostridium septicum]UEC21405.1 hypothetical protein LK444_03250 [Clostridium septicum]USS00549.1 hypothetical protein NH397_13840 [Clostridium septicum]